MIKSLVMSFRGTFDHWEESNTRKQSLSPATKLLRRSSALRFEALLAMTMLATLNLVGCISHVENPITRTETDYYTITDRDTTYHETVRNVPGSSADNGVVFPSSREIDIDRNTLSHDSTYDRRYPNFLRAGGIEVAGLVGSTVGSSTPGVVANGIGPGLLGIFSLFTSDQYTHPGTMWIPGANPASQIFKGELVRLMPYEYRLRWFNDAPNWTVGWSAFELIAPDELRENWLASVGTNIYIRRRIFLRDRIPYIIFDPFLGVSAFPSAYLNLGGELQLGSLAGFNLRAYAGLTSGWTSWSAGKTVTFPYFALGVSALDFTNTVEETERQWKDYTHTAIQTNIIEATLLRTTPNYLSIWSDSTIPFNAAQIRFANAELPLPFGNDHFWAGTSLINWIAMGFDKQGIGILPLRAGYRQYLFGPDLMLEPFVELNYYPSTIFNIGAQLKLDTHTQENIGITLGYATGSPGDFEPQIFNHAGVESTSFSAAYLGVSIFLGDWDQTPEKVMADRVRESSE